MVKVARVTSRAAAPGQQGPQVAVYRSCRWNVVKKVRLPKLRPFQVQDSVQRCSAESQASDGHGQDHDQRLPMGRPYPDKTLLVKPDL